MSAKKDLTGQRFGRLTVIAENGSNRYRQMTWQCLCECGNRITVVGHLLTGGHTKSCGCLKLEQSIRNLPNTPSGEDSPTYKHGGEGTRLYRIWKGMRQRCYNPNIKNYANYGGRGITVCDEWRNSFEAFRDWALANGYCDDLSIDRIDNDKGYSPDNCRWATSQTQALNRRKFKCPQRQKGVKCLETGEVFKSVKEAAQRTGAPYTSISNCLHGKLKKAGGFHWEIYEKDAE